MDMVLANMPFENLDLQLRTDRSHDLAEPETNVTPQQLFAVLGDPHQVGLDVKAGVCRSTVMFHPPVILERVA